jgi:hypothetical protein
MDKLFLPYKIVKEHFEQDMTDDVMSNVNAVSNANVNAVSNNSRRRKNRMCNTTMMYYFVSLVIMLYALSLALDRVRSNPNQNEFVSMFIVLSSLFCSPCYLVFEFVSMLLNSGSSSNMAPRIVFVR